MTRRTPQTKGKTIWNLKTNRTSTLLTAISQYQDRRTLSRRGAQLLTIPFHPFGPCMSPFPRQERRSLLVLRGRSKTWCPSIRSPLTRISTPMLQSRACIKIHTLYLHSSTCLYPRRSRTCSYRITGMHRRPMPPLLSVFTSHLLLRRGTLFPISQKQKTRSTRLFFLWTPRRTFLLQRSEMRSPKSSMLYSRPRAGYRSYGNADEPFTVEACLCQVP